MCCLIRHDWLILPDVALPWRRVRYCVRCGRTQAQITGAFWGTLWRTVPTWHWTRAVRRAREED